MKYVGTFVAAMLLLSMSMPLPATGDDIVIEAELYTASHDIAGLPIAPSGYYLWGLDYPDEWTEYEFEVGNEDSYAMHVLMRGDDGVTCTLELCLTSAVSGDTQTCEVSFLGTGIT